MSGLTPWSRCRWYAVGTLYVLGSTAVAQESWVDIRREICASCRGLVQTLDRVRFDLTIDMVAFNRRPQDWHANVAWTLDSDRILVDLVGRNVLEPADALRPGAPSIAKLNWLFRAGGWTERKDLATDGLDLMQRTYSDPRGVSFGCLPPDALWLLGSGLKESVVANSRFEIVAVEGSRPARVATMTGVTKLPAGDEVHYRFAFREEWGWLTSEVNAVTRIGGAEQLYRTHELRVHSVHTTPLCCTPAKWEMIYWNCRAPDDVADVLPVTHWRVEMSPPRFDFEALPAHVDARVGPCSGDQMLDGSSFISHEKLMTRGASLNQLVAAGRREIPVPSAGVLGSRLSLWWVCGGLLAAATAALGFRRGGTSLYWTSLALLSLLLVAALFPGGWTRHAQAAGIPWRPLAPGDPALESRFLCGPDALFILASMHGREVEYPELVRYVRPGMEGATLAQLMIAAECLDFEPCVTSASNWDAPPGPCLVHLYGSHFAAMLSAGDGNVVVCEPVKGVLAARWSDLQPHAGALLTLRPRERS